MDLGHSWYEEVDGRRQRIISELKKRWDSKKNPTFKISISNKSETTYYHKKLGRVINIDNASELTENEANAAIDKIIESRAKVTTELIKL